MTTDERGGDVLPFPHVALPPSFTAGSVPLPPAPADDPSDVPPVGAWPSLPDLSTMRPPMHLTVPGVEEPESDADGEGEFVPPSPEDPERPGLRDAAVMGLAVLAACGVAAAHGMWHVTRGAKARADHRLALARQASKSGGKADGKLQPAPLFGRSAKAGHGQAGGGAGSTSKVPASLRSNSPGKSGDRSHGGRSALNGPKGKADSGRGLSGAHGGSGRHGGKSHKDGKHSAGLERAKGRNERAAARQERRAKLRATKRDADLADRTKDRDLDRDQRRRAAKDARRAAKKEKAKKSKDAKASGRTTLGQSVSQEAERRLAARRAELAPPILSKAKPKVDLKKHRKDGKAAKDTAADKSADPPASEAGGPDSTPGDTPGPDPASAGGPSTGPAPGADPPPPPPGFDGMPGFGGMRPPPGADRRYTVTLERDDPPPAPPTPAGEIGPARPALPAAKASPTAARFTRPGTTAPAVPAQRGARFVSTPVKTTQYKDAELTIYDVIDADSDMSEEITEGVDEAIKAANGCDKLITKLEALHAKIVELKVPGVLEGMVVRLVEKTETVKARAEAIAANLPRASEAISTAGTNAESRHRHLADVTRDMGHVRPADRDYHNE